MEGLAVMGFVFGMVGVVALVRLEKLTKTLKEKGILEERLQGRVIHCLNLVSHSRVDSYVNVFETTTLFLEFSIEFESNDLTYHQPYSKKQQITYDLIKHLLNIRFQPMVEERMTDILNVGTTCQRQNWNKSDLIRHFTRVGIKQREHNMRGNKQ